MALVTPIGISIPAFDATQSQIFSFTVQGGDQVVGNILTIIDNISGSVVYQNEVESYVYNQVVPANTLLNNKYYAFHFVTKNINGNTSNTSSNVTFRTFTTPTLTFVNIPSTSIIESGSYDFTVQYNQSEGELLNTLRFYLYDAAKKQIQSSSVYTSVSNPPINFIHQFNGFIDDEKYYVRAMATTVYGTEIDTGYVEINIDYSYEGAYFAVTATNNPKGGYVQIFNNIAEIDGQVYNYLHQPISPTYINHDSLLLENGNYLLWEDGFSFANNAFTAQKWWSPVWLGIQDTMSNLSSIDPTEGSGRSYITIKLQRGIPQGQVSVKDYLVVEGYIDDVKYFTQHSNYVNALNNNSKLITFLQIDGENVNVVLTKISYEGSSSIKFNGTSNVEYNKLTNMFWEGESEQTVELTDDFQSDLFSVKYLSNVKLEKTTVSGYYVTHDMSRSSYYSTLPDWDNYTIMRADFDDNLNAGNVDWVLNSVNNIKVKRRRIGTDEQYITLYVQPISTVYDLSFNYRDYYVPSGYEYEYAMCPSVNNDEQAYFTTSVKTYFDGLFVSDKDTTMKLYGNYLIGQSNDNMLIGMVQPYNQTYPVIIQNTNVKYRTVSIQGDILGLQDNVCEQFVLTQDKRPIIVDQKREWDKFLCNGKTKVIKDWNGNIMVAKITTPPSYTYSQGSGNSKPTLVFGATEVGEYDNQSSMYRNGLIDVEIE